MRLCYLVLVAVLIGIASGKIQKPNSEAKESSEEQLVSTTIEEPPTGTGQNRETRGEVESKEEGLNSEEVNREFEEYDESSSEKVTDQTEYEPATTDDVHQSSDNETNDKNEKKSNEEVSKDESVVDENSGEEENKIEESPTDNEAADIKEKKEKTVDEAEGNSEEIEEEEEIEDESAERDDVEQAKSGEGKNDEESKEDSSSEEVEEEPELHDEETVPEKTDSSQGKEEENSTDNELNEGGEPEDSEEIDPEEELEDKNDEEGKDERIENEVEENKEPIEKEEESDPTEVEKDEQPDETVLKDDSTIEPENREEDLVKDSGNGETEASTDEQNDDEEPPSVEPEIAAESDPENTISNVYQPADVKETDAVVEKNVSEKIIEQAEKAFAELLNSKEAADISPALGEATTNIEQAVAEEVDGTSEREVASENAVPTETIAEETEAVEEVKVTPSLTNAEIRAAIIAEAEKAYKYVIQKTDKADEAEELKTEPKLNESEEKEIKKLMTNALEKKEEAIVEKEEQAEEDSLVNEIKNTANLVRLKRAAKELAEDPTVQPAGASPVELPMETKDTTGKNETLPAKIEKDVPKEETVKQDLAQQKFTDGFGWVHYPWRKLPVSKKRFHYEKQCECEVVWMKKVYTRRHPKSKLLLVKNSYVDLNKSRRRCKKRLPVTHSVHKMVVHHAPKPCKKSHGARKQIISKLIRHFHGTSLAEKSWRDQVKGKKMAIVEGKKSFAKKFRAKCKTPFMHRPSRTGSLRH